MSKLKSKYICNKCNTEHIKWAGKCKECGEYNTLIEEVYEEISKQETKNRISKRNSKGYSDLSGEVVLLSEVKSESFETTKTQFKSLDIVLSGDGGIVKGGIVLVGGDPGIGKSTLLLQLSTYIASLDNHKVLYVSGEESGGQIASRAKRLNLKNDQLLLQNEAELELILKTIKEKKPTLLIIDSIQSMYSSALSSAPGGVSQVLECATAISTTCKNKELNTSVFIIGHITKNGDLAGPKALFHIVDTVLQFEGDSESNFRTLSVEKNRYGSTSEMAIFEMDENGLTEVLDPSVIFLENDYSESCIGTVILASQEKNKAFLVEVQSLIDQNESQYAKRVANGVEYNRLIIILAIINGITNGIKLSNYDVFINVLSGIKLNDTSSDLAVFLSIMSSLLSQKIKPKTVVFGEISLNGKLRLSRNFEQRIATAERNGFEYIVMPIIKDKKILSRITEKNKKIKIIMCNDVIEAKKFCFS